MPKDAGARFESHVAERNVSAARLACVLVAILMPAGVTLDWVTHPEMLERFLVLRLAAGAISALLLLLTYAAWAKRMAFWLGAAPAFVAAGAIEVMVESLEGYASPYYAGLNLCILGLGLVFTWRGRETALVCILIVTAWLLPALLGSRPIELGPFFNNFYFLVLTSLIAVASNAGRYALARREYDGRMQLASASAELAAALSRLKELDRLKSEFFANVTHELRTPLTMILAPIESMLAGDFGPLEPTQRAYLEANWRNGIRLLKLINDLLDMAKLEEGFLRLRPEKTDMAHLLGEVVDYARPLAARKRLTLDLTIGTPPRNLRIDREQMDRVFVNLISNALKFTEAGGVRVSLDTKSTDVEIAIEDTGIGIAPDRLGSIFDRFSQGDASVTRRYGGTGIGLAFAREIVELHGGWITVSSTPGRGSRFVIHLQEGEEHISEQVRDRRVTGEGDTALKRADDQEPREWTIRLQQQLEYRFCEIGDVTERRVVPRNQGPAKATRILVVEDNVEILQLIHLQLQHQHTVLVAQNGAQGLDMALRELPDIIVSDFMMPEMDGLTMLRALRGNPVTAEIPFIMLTAKNQLEDRLSARDAGADIYLSKPFSARELETAVRQLLQKRGRQVGHLIRAHVEGLETISAALAHEIHNPLSTVKNAQALIVENVAKIHEAMASTAIDDAERLRVVTRARDKIERVAGSAGRGLQRIEQVVQLVRRYARDGYPSEPEDMLLDAAISDVTALVAPRGDDECALSLDLQASRAAVSCIPEEMQQVVRNLVQNGIDAAGPRGHVRVQTRVSPEGVVMEVSDDGPGVPAELRTKIFSPFFTTKGPGSGLGLGLAIVHRVVTRAGGSVELETAVGKGSTFRIRLPVSRRSEAVPRARAEGG